MPPKKSSTASAESGDGDGVASAVTALCHLIMSCDDFKADNSKLAPILGIAQAKNVPRKINSIVSPYGFEFKNGTILNRDGHGQGEEEKATEGKKEKKVKPKAKAKTKGQDPASKKRKLAASEAEDEDEANAEAE